MDVDDRASGPDAPTGPDGPDPRGGYGLSVGDVHDAIVAAFRLAEEVDGTAVGDWWVDDVDRFRPGWFLLTDGERYLNVGIDVTLSMVDRVGALTGPSSATEPQP